MKISTLLVLLCFVELSSYAQIFHDTTTYQYIFVDELPRFGECKDDLPDYLLTRLRLLEKYNITEKITVSFVINTDGKVQDVYSLKSGVPLCEKVVSEILYSMPKWRPGKVYGRVVRVRMFLELWINRIN